MVSLPSVGQLLDELLANLLEQYASAFRRWFDDVTAQYARVWNALPNLREAFRQLLILLPFLGQRLFTLFDDLLTSPIAAVWTTLAEIAVAAVPPEWNTQVVKRKQAWIDCCDALIQGGKEAGGLQLPLNARIYLWVGRIKAYAESAKGTLKGVRLLVVGSVVSAILKAIDLLLRLLGGIAVVLVILMFWRFAVRVNKGQSLVPLGQSASRTKWFATRGAPTKAAKLRIIRRRDPGGNPP